MDLKCYPILIWFTLLSGCVYRFTNTAIHAPHGIKSVAVEAVYDTSREVLPHEQLWNALQRSIAENGRLRLTNQEQADALLRAQITAGDVNPSGTPDNDQIAADPKLARNEIKGPNEFRILPQAGSWTNKENLSYSILVELWDLRDHSLLFRRSYSGSDQFQSILAEDRTQLGMQYLIYEESLNTKFRTIAKSISDKVVTDIFFQ